MEEFTSLDAKLKDYFSGKIVRKDLTKRLKEGINVPVYVLEYLLGMYCAADSEEAIAKGVETVKSILANNYVRPDEAEKIRSLIRERGSYTIIDKVTVKLNTRVDAYQAFLANLGEEGVAIEDKMVKDFDRLLIGGIWCILNIICSYNLIACKFNLRSIIWI